MPSQHHRSGFFGSFYPRPRSGRDRRSACRELGRSSTYERWGYVRLDGLFPNDHGLRLFAQAREQGDVVAG